jgi:hypothetical protein
LVNKRERSYFIAVLKKLNSGKPVKNDALPNIAEKYFLENAGLIQFEIDHLKTRLSKASVHHPVINQWR